MINFEALFKISYGLYIVASGDKEYGNGYISNTVFQVTAEPARFATCCNKENHTADIIAKYGTFSVSVLHQETDPKVYGKFGYQSGKSLDKLKDANVSYGSTGVPIVMDEAIAFLECRVQEKIDVGTHWLFIGELVDAQVIDDSKEPITYDFFRKVKKGIAPKNAPTYINKSKLEKPTEEEKAESHRCLVCGHIHDDAVEDQKFKDLSDDWQCPICGADKEDFEKV
jgi:flavin reductase (DIM6/NTAB) family NADH-FMN oxidoreductase RutF/rubredoxin